MMDPQEPHADLMSTTRTLLKISAVQVELVHVKGHQDKNILGPLTRDTTLNIEVDQLAHTKLTSSTTGPQWFHIPWSQGVCYTGAQQVEKFGNTIWDHINGLTMKAYWETQRDLTEEIWNHINWESIGQAMQEVPVNRQHWVSKYVSGHFATGWNIHKWKFRTATQCPRCPKPVEDKCHILECPNPSAHELWGKSLKQPEDWLKSEGTERSIQEQLMHGLWTWTTPKHLLTTPESPLKGQEWIRKHYMWDGSLSIEWRQQQEQLWKQVRSRKSSWQWMSEIIKKLWNIAWDMWEQRNDTLHKSEQNWEAILKCDTNNKIKQTYAIRPGQLARTDFGLMAHTLEHHLGQPHHTQNLSLESIVEAIHRRKLHKHGAMTTEQWLMETWVVRNPTQPPLIPTSQWCTPRQKQRPQTQTCRPTP